MDQTGSVKTWTKCIRKRVKGTMDVEHLAACLAAHCESDKEKFKEVFHWVAKNIVYDVEAYHKGVALARGVGAGLAALRTGKALCSGFADLLQRMCGELGIECLKVRGFVKGYGYIPGDTFQGRPANHEWNVVCVDGTWYQSDLCWAAGYVQETSSRYVCDFEDQYFLAKPCHFILDHFPWDSKWQLLEEPVTLSEFEGWAHIKPGFIKNGIGLYRMPKGVQQVDGDITISLDIPRYVSLSYELKHIDSNQECSKCVAFRIFRTSADYKLQPPWIGRYSFKLYGRSATKEEPVGLIVYTLDVISVSSEKLPLLDLKHPWGPTRFFQDNGVNPVGELSSILRPEKGECTIRYSCDDQTVNFKAELFRIKDGRLLRCPNRTFINHPSSNLIDIRARLPNSGHYWLAIYCYSYPLCSKSLKCVANYLLLADQEETTALEDFPRTSARWRRGCALSRLPRSEIKRSPITLRVPGAKRVVSIFGDKQWNFTLDQNQMWHSNITTFDSNTVTICAKYLDSSEKYFKLLEYHVTNNVGLNEPENEMT